MGTEGCQALLRSLVAAKGLKTIVSASCVASDDARAAGVATGHAVPKV